jgi:hypothetical protein
MKNPPSEIRSDFDQLIQISRDFLTTSFNAPISLDRFSSTAPLTRIIVNLESSSTLEILHFGRIRTLRTVNGRSRGFIAPDHKSASICLLLDVRKEITRVRGASTLRAERSRLGPSREFIKIRTVRNSMPVRPLPPVDSLRVPQKERTEGIGMESGWDSLGVRPRQLREPDHGRKPRERTGIRGPRAGKAAYPGLIRYVAEC